MQLTIHTVKDYDVRSPSSSSQKALYSFYITQGILLMDKGRCHPLPAPPPPLSKECLVFFKKYTRIFVNRQGNRKESEGHGSGSIL